MEIADMISKEFKAGKKAPANSLVYAEADNASQPGKQFRQ
jgi:hypothetical protein